MGTKFVPDTSALEPRGFPRFLSCLKRGQFVSPVSLVHTGLNVIQFGLNVIQSGLNVIQFGLNVIQFGMNSFDRGHNLSPRGQIKNGVKPAPSKGLR